MTHAYDKDYLYHAQNNFGHMIDFVVNTCELDLETYVQMFLSTDVCEQFETGNPAYIAGKTGCELARMVLWETKEEQIEELDVMYMDKSPEFWTGWVLAYYTWLRNYKFSHVLKAITIDEVLCMYDTLHEADVSKVVEILDERLAEYYKETALTRMRKLCEISQFELARKSGVNVRVIQSYEQRLRDINKAQFSTIMNLAAALECSPEALMEK